MTELLVQNPAAVIATVMALMLVVGPVISYNRFVNQRNLIDNSWSNIDTELRRRYDLIPNLVETVKGYAAHERAVFEEVTNARASAIAQGGTPQSRQQTEEQLGRSLRHLFAVAEGYPELRASSHFLALQHELSYTEDRIQAARRFYNSNVADYNRRLESFPSNLIGGMFGFKPATFFEIQPALRAAVESPPRVAYKQA